MSSSHVQEDYPLVGSYGSENGKKWVWVAGIAFVCWNILLFSLAVAAIAKVNDIKEPKAPEPPIFSQSVSGIKAVNTIGQLSVVSLLPDGTARTGAGTTIYSKTTPPPPFGVGSQNVRVARFVDQGSLDQIIVVWTNSSGSYAVLGTLSLDKQNVNGWFVPVKMPFETFADVITLSTNHFVIATDQALWAGTADMTAMNISSLKSAPYPQAVKTDIRLTPLGTNNFVLSWDTGFININVSVTNTFGVVVGSVLWDMVNKTPNITFLTNAETWPGGFPVHAAFALTDTTLVLAYGSPPGETTGPQLACRFVRFTHGSPTLTISEPTIYPGVEPQFHLSAVGLDSTTGAILVVDKLDGYALRSVLVHRSPNVIDGVHFGDISTVESGVGDAIFVGHFQNGKVPFIDTARVSANKVAVAWADYSNSGRLTTAILTVDQASNVHVSPLYVIGQPLTLDQLYNYSVSVAGLSIDAYGQIGAVVIDRKSATDAAGSGNVALIEVAPKAFGVAAHNAFAGNSVNVVVSGLVSLPSSFPTDLQPGHLYYGRTDGSLMAGPLAGSVDRSAQYLTLADGSIVTTDSAVGLAVSKRQLYVLPSY